MDFLYPPQTREFAASLLRPPRRFGPRRKRVISNSSRSYSSKTPSPHDLDDADNLGTVPNISGQQNEDVGGHEAVEQTRDRDKLKTLLHRGGPADYGLAWDLYASSGYPIDLNSPLLAYFCHSTSPRDHERSKHLFDGLSTGVPSADDYLHMAISYWNRENSPPMIAVTQDAVARDIGGPCWAFALAKFLGSKYTAASRETWEARPQLLGKELAGLFASWLDPLFLPRALILLAPLIEEQRDDDSVRRFVSSLLKKVLTSSEITGGTAVGNLLSLLQEYSDLGIARPEDYLTLIKTLANLGPRSGFVKSMVAYRHFRWQTKDVAPDAKLLRLILRRLVEFNITSGVQYLLSELKHFNKKPRPGDYLKAMIAFSRAGDAKRVAEYFETLVRENGRPPNVSYTGPLLHVHASAGNVPETLKQFKRMSNEFGMEQHTTGWNILMTAHLNNDDPSGAISTFDEMLKEGVEPDSHSFGILLGFCANRGDVDGVLHLLSLVREYKVKVTAPLLHPIVEAYCNNGLIDLAEQVAEACLGLRVDGDMVRMWNLLLWHHAFRIDLEAIARIRTRMERAGLLLDGFSYGALMLSLTLIGKTDSARRILRALHRSRRMHATEFHYAIILYGYVRSRNRDMVHIVFREIKERFSRPSFSSRLLLLRSQIQRDLEAINRRPSTAVTGRLEHAENFLRETIRDSDIMMLATKEPSVGTARESLHQAYPSMYYEYVISAYGRIGALPRAKALFEEFINIRHNLTFGDARNLPPLRLLTVLMDAHVNDGDFEAAENVWLSIFPQAVKLAQRFDIRKHLSGSPSAKDATESIAPPANLTGAKKTASILPSYRFSLDRPLNIYLRSLAFRGDIGKISDVVDEVEGHGFALTTFNWSLYVQLLASARETSYQLQAFAIFEEKFMPNFPGWQHLVRSRGLKPPEAPVTTNVMDRRPAPPHLLGKDSRKQWSRLKPDFMQPTYVCVVQLAASLQRLRENSVSAGTAHLKKLYAIAPRTVDAIAKMPRRRDKYQGVLLRGRGMQGDWPTRERQPFVWTGGALGVGGRTRTAKDVREQLETPLEEQPSEDEAGPAADVSLEQEAQAEDDLSYEGNLMGAEPTIDPQDQHDIETEAELEARRHAFEPSDEELDVELPDEGEEEEEDEVPNYPAPKSAWEIRAKQDAEIERARSDE